MDDVLIASRTRKLHIEHLQVVLELLVQNGLVLNLDKCIFVQHEIEYLGHKITVDGIVPLRRHVDALLLQPYPQDVRGLQRFLGMINFYHRFLPGIARTLRPLTDASNTHVGAALQQKESGGWRPQAIFSAKLSATQKRYSALDRELLGVFLTFPL